MLGRLKKLLKELLLLSSALLATSPWSPGCADPMKFHGKPPSFPAEVVGTAWDVFARVKSMLGQTSNF
jgi:hypothetical protein